MIGSIPSIRRHVKNVACNYSDAQVKVRANSFPFFFSVFLYCESATFLPYLSFKVREATSNDPWGPSSSIMSEIADMTFNTMAFSEVMQMIWKRLNDHGKNWRHVYKSLVLLDYLIKLGSEKVAQQCRENIYAIQTLKDFQHIEDNKDQGINVREKAKQLVAILRDEERLKTERSKALSARKRFTQNGMAISSDGSSYAPRVMDRHRKELEECRPSSIGEEELQLQIALAISKEEAQKEEEMKRGDDVRLRMALNKSRTEYAHSSTENDDFHLPAASKTSALDDLLSLQSNISQSSAEPSHKAHENSDIWGGSGSPFPDTGLTNDPWTAVTPTPAQPQTDPWGGHNGLPPITQLHSTQTDISTNGEKTDSSDVQASQSARLGSAVSGGLQPVTDPWLNDGISAATTNESSTRRMKTPETFLGENSSLVNLDNLVGPSKPIIPGMPPQFATGRGNPFLTDNGKNPFVSQQRPSPTLNEMKAAAVAGTTTTATWRSSQSDVRSAWDLQQPLQPQRPASTNPFL
ncbi:unnamed protein product [Soboliphyme baturini]|uniref:ENTH domain-containing protein n=1 Tax=Soboliphyme baturini TaxID=241478 RepID=A0A183IMS1_9BILA|nr:unnamed protein product [Soboliphyme baturini]